MVEKSILSGALMNIIKYVEQDQQHELICKVRKRKNSLVMCAQQRFRSACAVTQPDQNLQSGFWQPTMQFSVFMKTKKTDLTAWMCRLVWVYAGRPCQKVRFLRLWLKCLWIALACFVRMLVILTLHWMILWRNVICNLQELIAPHKTLFQPQIYFLFLHKNICCWYSLEVPQWDTSNEYP